MATLCQIGEDGSITGRWELGSQPLVVGRDDAVDAHVEDEAASRRHAIILPEGNHYIIQDLGSQNGTWVDGRRVLTAKLYHQAQIVVGQTQFLFLDQPPTAITMAKTQERFTEPGIVFSPAAPPPPAPNRSGVRLPKAA